MNPHLQELIEIMQSMEARCYEPNANAEKITYLTKFRLRVLEVKMQVDQEGVKK